MLVPQQKIVSSYRQTWVDHFSSDPALFQQSLLDLGLPHRDLQSDLEAYRDTHLILEGPSVPKNIHFRGPDAYEVMADEIAARRANRFAEAIRDLIARREYLIEDSELRSIKVPIFWLTCPSAEHSTVQYQEEITEGVDAALTLTVFGTGMGAAQTVKMTYTSEFEAAAGQYKTLFVQFPLRVYRMGVYEKGAKVGTGLRSEVPEGQQSDFSLGIDSETTAHSDAAYRGADVVEEKFPLSGDTSSSVHSFSQAVERKGEIELSSGLKAFDLELTSKTKIYRGTKVKLTFKLPAGFDYHLKRDRNGTGIWWSETGPAAR